MTAQTTETKLELIQQDLTYIKTDIDELKRMQQEKFITRVEFESKFYPVKRIAYGIVGIFGTIIGALFLWALTTILGNR